MTTQYSPDAPVNRECQKKAKNQGLCLCGKKTSCTDRIVTGHELTRLPGPRLFPAPAPQDVGHASRSSTPGRALDPTSMQLPPSPPSCSSLNPSHRLFIFHSASTSQGGDPCPQVDWGPDTTPVQSPKSFPMRLSSLDPAALLCPDPSSVKSLYQLKRTS